MGATTAPQLSPVTPAAIRNILFATDFSLCSETALPVALAFAKRYGAAFFVTHVPPEDTHYEPSREQEAQQRFDALLASGVLNDVVHEPILRTGELWPTIQDVISTRAI